jgi:hypothetical protein
MPSLWSSGQSSWLQIQRPRLDSRRYQIFLQVVGLENGVQSASWVQLRSYLDLEIRGYSRREPSLWPRGTLFAQKLALNSPTKGCRSGIACSRTQAAEFFLVYFFKLAAKGVNITFSKMDQQYRGIEHKHVR